jgi:hypothetical protein
MDKEIWKPVPGFGGHYEASSIGNVRSKDRVVIRKNPNTGKPCKFFYKSKILRPCSSDKYGHQSVHISVDCKKQTIFVHTMVLLAFVGERPDNMECCHINGDARDNRIENLRWDTHYSNNQDRKRHGRYSTGKDHPMSKLTDKDVLAIRSSGKSNKELRNIYRISNSQMHRILTKQSWKHL